MKTKEQFQQVEDRVLAWSPVWQERLCVAHWEIEHVFLDTQFSENEAGTDFLITADTQARWQYFMAKIRWYLPSAVRHDAVHLEKTLVHELVHVQLGTEQALVFTRAVDAAEGMTDADSDKLMEMYAASLEQATEIVTRSLWKAYGPTAI